MAFVGAYAMALSAGVKTALPWAQDLSGNSSFFCPYSHARVPGGTTYTWDTGNNAIVVVASTDTITPVPAGAMYITATGASSIQLGKSS